MKTGSKNKDKKKEVKNSSANVGLELKLASWELMSIPLLPSDLLLQISCS